MKHGILKSVLLPLLAFGSVYAEKMSFQDLLNKSGNEHFIITEIADGSKFEKPQYDASTEIKKGPTVVVKGYKDLPDGKKPLNTVDSTLEVDVSNGISEDIYWEQYDAKTNLWKTYSSERFESPALYRLSVKYSVHWFWGDREKVRDIMSPSAVAFINDSLMTADSLDSWTGDYTELGPTDKVMSTSKTFHSKTFVVGLSAYEVVSSIKNGTIRAPEYIFPGEDVVVEITPDEGYEFEKVNINYDKSFSDDGRIPAIVVVENNTYRCLFKPVATGIATKIVIASEIHRAEKTVMVMANDEKMGYVKGIDETGIYDTGSKLEIEAVANPGYKFVDWQDSNTFERRAIEVTNDMAYIANFEPVSDDEKKFDECSEAYRDFISHGVPERSSLLLEIDDKSSILKPELNGDAKIFPNANVLAKILQKKGYYEQVDLNVVDSNELGWLENIERPVVTVQRFSGEKWEDYDNGFYEHGRYRFKISYSELFFWNDNVPDSGIGHFIYKFGNYPKLKFNNEDLTLENVECVKQKNGYEQSIYSMATFYSKEYELLGTQKINKVTNHARIITDDDEVTEGKTLNFEVWVDEGYALDYVKAYACHNFGNVIPGECRDPKEMPLSLNGEDCSLYVPTDDYKDIRIEAVAVIPSSADESSSSSEEVQEDESSSSDIPSSAEESSSSSEEVQEDESSSSVISSSTEESSSSSSKKKDESSSSSKKKDKDSKSSSSSKKAESSSSSKKGKTTVAETLVAPQFRVTTIARNIQISGARVGASYAVLDMQGRVMLKGYVDNANFNLTMPQSGTYMLTIGNESERVTVR